MIFLSLLAYFHLEKEKKELQMRTVGLQTYQGDLRERLRTLHLLPGKSLRPNSVQSDGNSPKTHLDAISTQPTIRPQTRRENHYPSHPPPRKNNCVFWWGLYNAENSFTDEQKQKQRGEVIIVVVIIAIRCIPCCLTQCFALRFSHAAAPQKTIQIAKTIKTSVEREGGEDEFGLFLGIGLDGDAFVVVGYNVGKTWLNMRKLELRGDRASRRDPCIRRSKKLWRGRMFIPLPGQNQGELSKIE